MNKRILYKKALLEALKEAGLPHTMINFVNKYERTLCQKPECPLVGLAYLRDFRDAKGRRIYSREDIDQIIKTAKEGWFDRHWHWPWQKRMPVY